MCEVRFGFAPRGRLGGKAPGNPGNPWLQKEREIWKMENILELVNSVICIF